MHFAKDAVQNCRNLSPWLVRPSNKNTSYSNALFERVIINYRSYVHGDTRAHMIYVTQ